MKKLPCVLAFFVALFVPKGAYGQEPIRVHCGGPAYTDSKGQFWQADTGFNGGTTSSTTQKLGERPIRLSIKPAGLTVEASRRWFTPSRSPTGPTT